jgi:hypothetical protein
MAGWLALEDSAHGGDPNSVRIEPAAAVAAPGGTVAVSLVAEPPTNGLNSWEITVKYDNSLVVASACTPDPEGDCDIISAPDSVASSGSASAVIIDPFAAADITFEATGASGACTPLEVQVTSFIDANNIESNPIVTHGEICLQGTPVPTVPATPVPTPADPPCPRFVDFDPANFTDPTIFDNPLLPLIPGRQLVLDGVADGVPRRVIFTSTDVTKVINGVTTLVVWDRDFRDGILAEEELAFFAQDDDGNVWNLGEYPEELLNGVFNGAPNTWIAGLDEAEGGVHMPAEPVLNEPAYLQGWAPNIDFLDCARIISLGEHVCVPVSCYDNVVVTNETSPLDPAGGSQQKYHAPDIGIVNITATDNPLGETIALTSASELSSEDLAAARGRALALDAHAYEVIEFYVETEPAEGPPGAPTPGPTPDVTPTPAGSATPTPEPVESPTPTPNGSATATPEPDESPTPTPGPDVTPAPTSVDLASPTPASGSTIIRPTPTATPIPTPARTPLNLAAARAPRQSLRSARSLPSAGGNGSGDGGPISVGWMVPASLGMVILGAYVFGTVRRTAVQEAGSPSPLSSQIVEPGAIDTMFERLQALKQERLDERVDETNDDTPQGGRVSRDD